MTETELRKAWEAWEEGARAFNEGRHWDAHEAWERGWRELPEAVRAEVQALILAAGALVHLAAGRGGPGQALVARALERLADRDAASGGGAVALSAPEVEAWLRDAHARWGRRGAGREPSADEARAEAARAAGLRVAVVEGQAWRT
jgi:uncharacterized protein